MTHGTRTLLSAGFALVTALVAPFAAIGLIATLVIGLLASMNITMSDTGLVPTFGAIAVFTLVAGSISGMCACLSRRLGSDSAAQPGCCTGCGYDLRGSAERCPECGKPIRVET